jgi:hypothetical protein
MPTWPLANIGYSIALSLLFCALNTSRGHLENKSADWHNKTQKANVFSILCLKENQGLLKHLMMNKRFRNSTNKLSLSTNNLSSDI